jgi:hypothetical protein
MPSYQGELDGLCGPYAIANTFETLGYADPEAVFKTACAALGQRRWPEVLWEGTTIDDMQKMIKACLKKLDNTSHLSVSYPFESETPKNNKSYWERFDDIFDDQSVVCAIVGRTKPSLHWIIVTRDGGRLQFIDTSPTQRFVRKNRSSIYAGERPKGSNQWAIDRRELIVFSSK